MEHLEFIVKNGSVRIPSIFMFEYFEDLTVFLSHAKKANCIVVFENERFAVDPNNDDTIIRAKIHAYSAVIACRDIGNAYLRYLGDIDNMSWDNVNVE